MKTYGIFLVLWLAVTTAFAQDDNTIFAFSKSYEQEKANNYNAAIATLKNVYDANSYEMNLRLGWLTYAAGQQTESLNYYKKAIALKPMSIEAKLGFVYPASVLGNWNQVAEQYQAILGIDAQHSTANYRMGLIHYNKKEYDKAYKYFEKVVNLYPFDYLGLLYFGWTNYQMGKLPEAKALFRKVLLYDPTYASAKEGLSLIK